MGGTTGTGADWGEDRIAQFMREFWAEPKRKPMRVKTGPLQVGWFANVDEHRPIGEGFTVWLDVWRPTRKWACHAGKRKVARKIRRKARHQWQDC